jgi:hypothetical protein
VRLTRAPIPGYRHTPCEFDSRTWLTDRKRRIKRGRASFEVRDPRGSHHCWETLAPLTVLSPGPRLAGTPAKGRKIWESWAPPTDTRLYLQNCQLMLSMPRLAHISR